MSQLPIQCRLNVFASTRRNHAMAFRRNLEGELARFPECRGMELSVEARSDEKGVVILHVPSTYGGADLLRSLGRVAASVSEMFEVFPEYRTSQVEVTGDGILGRPIGHRRILKQPRRVALKERNR